MDFCGLVKDVLITELPWADHDDWLKLPTTKDENPRTRNGGGI